jgi:hypothetical protein
MILRGLMFLCLVSVLNAGEATNDTGLVASIEGETIHLNELQVGPLQLGDVAARPQLKDRVLSFTDCQASFYGGTVRGSIILDLNPEKNRTYVTAEVTGVDLNALLAALGSTTDAHTGRVDGRIELNFPTNAVRQAQGRARLTVSDGNLVEMSFLANLLVGNIGNVRNQDSAEVTAEIRQPLDNGENRGPRDSIVHLSSARITLAKDKGVVLVSGSVSLGGDLRLLVVPKVAGGVLSQVWLVGKWFGSALAFASSRVARVVVRGTVSSPVIVLNPLASE